MPKRGLFGGQPRAVQFCEVGTALSAKMLGRSRGFGFVEVARKAGAEPAAARLRGCKINKRETRTRRAAVQRPGRSFSGRNE